MCVLSVSQEWDKMLHSCGKPADPRCNDVDSGVGDEGLCQATVGLGLFAKLYN